MILVYNGLNIVYHEIYFTCFFLISFNVATRKLKIGNVAHFLFSLDRAGLEYY